MRNKIMELLVELDTHRFECQVGPLANCRQWLELKDEAIKVTDMDTFQNRVAQWVRACLGQAVLADVRGRNHRFLEESLELVQSLGCTKEDALMLVDYVFGRDKGEPFQEVGGVMVTLAALCESSQVPLIIAAETEAQRVWTVMEQIRAKHLTKPRGSPLLGAAKMGEDHF